MIETLLRINFITRRRAAGRRWYRRHKQAVLERMRAYYKAKRDECRRRAREWKAQNQDRVKQHYLDRLARAKAAR